MKPSLLSVPLLGAVLCLCMSATVAPAGPSVAGLQTVAADLQKVVDIGFAKAAVSIAQSAYQGFSAQDTPPNPPSAPDVEVSVQKTEKWVVNPIWLAIGGLAVLVLIALIVAASRNKGETTVIRG